MEDVYLITILQLTLLSGDAYLKMVLKCQSKLYTIILTRNSKFFIRGLVNLSFKNAMPCFLGMREALVRKGQK